MPQLEPTRPLELTLKSQKQQVPDQGYGSWSLNFPVVVHHPVDDSLKLPLVTVRIREEEPLELEQEIRRQRADFVVRTIEGLIFSFQAS